MEFINKGRPVFISFSSVDKEKVKTLVEKLEKKDIEVVTQSDNPLGDEITPFERIIGAGECIILFFSDAYFRSWHCMYEFYRINKFKGLNSAKKIICVEYDKDDDLKNDDTYIQGIVKEWAERKDKGEEDHGGVKSAAKDCGYYLEEIHLLRDYYRNKVRAKTDEEFSFLIKSVKDFFSQNKTPITNPREIFYKFDKDMWKNFVLRYTKPDGRRFYFIPDISRGLESDDDKQQFKAMINELIDKQIISDCDDDTELELNHGEEYVLRLKNNKSLCITMDTMATVTIDCYPLQATNKQAYKDWDGQTDYYDLSLPYEKVINKYLNGKGKVNTI